jgi:hypothetical protein
MLFKGRCLGVFGPNTQRNNKMADESFINCGSPNITAMINSRRKKWKWHAARVIEMSRKGNMEGRYV